SDKLFIASLRCVLAFDATALARQLASASALAREVPRTGLQRSWPARSRTPALSRPQQRRPGRLGLKHDRGAKCRSPQQAEAGSPRGPFAAAPASHPATRPLHRSPRCAKSNTETRKILQRFWLTARRLKSARQEKSCRDDERS